jgi:hypothetical protein
MGIEPTSQGWGASRKISWDRAYSLDRDITFAFELVRGFKKRFPEFLNPLW